MKQLIVFGCILVFGFMFIFGCDDDEAKANIIHEFQYTELSFSGFNDTIDSIDLILHMSMEETEGIGVQLSYILFYIILVEGNETEGFAPKELDCSDIDLSYNLQNCYLPGYHKTENSGEHFSVYPITLDGTEKIRILAILIGTDDNGNQLEIASKTEVEILVP